MITVYHTSNEERKEYNSFLNQFLYKQPHSPAHLPTDRQVLLKEKGSGSQIFPLLEERVG